MVGSPAHTPTRGIATMYLLMPPIDHAASRDFMRAAPLRPVSEWLITARIPDCAIESRGL